MFWRIATIASPTGRCGRSTIQLKIKATSTKSMFVTRRLNERPNAADTAGALPTLPPPPHSDRGLCLVDRFDLHEDRALSQCELRAHHEEGPEARGGNTGENLARRTESRLLSHGRSSFTFFFFLLPIKNTRDLRAGRTRLHIMDLASIRAPAILLLDGPGAPCSGWALPPGFLSRGRSLIALPLRQDPRRPIDDSSEEDPL